MASNAAEESMTSGISFTRIPPSIQMGLMSAEIPTMTRILNMFDPTMFPTAIAGDALKALVSDTTSSGALVIIDTTVSPTIKSDIPIRLARAEAPSVIKLAPPRIRRSPIINRIIFTSS